MVLIHFESEVNAIKFAYMAKLVFQVQKIDIKAQKIGNFFQKLME